MANIYKSNYTGSQIDEAIGEVINDKLQEKLIAGNNITISGNTISATVPTIPSITITNGTATTPTSDTVAVISGEIASGHIITNTKVNVATQAYVDKKSAAVEASVINSLDKEHIAYVNKENTFTERQRIVTPYDSDINTQEEGFIDAGIINVSRIKYTDDTKQYYADNDAILNARYLQLKQQIKNESGLTQHIIQLDHGGIKQVDYDNNSNINYGYIFPKTYPNKEVTLATIEDLTAQFGALNIQNGSGIKSIEQVKNTDGTTIPIKTKNPNAVAQGAPEEVEIGATGESAAVFGGAAAATAKRAFAAGTNTAALGKYSAAFGDNSVALGNESFVANSVTTASGQGASAFGNLTIASGYNSFAEGNSTVASGQVSHAAGTGTRATSNNQFVIGKYNAEDDNAIFIIGTGTDENNRINGFLVNKNGVAYSNGLPLATENVVIDKCNIVLTAAQGYTDLLIGQLNTTIKQDIITYKLNVGSGDNNNVVSQGASAAIGVGLNTNAYAQTVLGRYNKPDADAFFIVGNGTPDNIQNAFEVLGDGRAKVQTAPKDNDDVVRKLELDTKLDKAGGTVTGDMVVSGDFTVQGRTTTVDSENLRVTDKLIEVGKGNTAPLTSPAGLITPKYDGTNNGGIVYDHTGTAYVGDITLDSNGNVDVNNSDLQPIATRDYIITDGNIVEWDDTNKTLIDTGKAVSDLSTATNLENGEGQYSLIQKVAPSTTTDPNNYARGKEAVALGRYNKTYGDRSMTVNYDNENYGMWSFVANTKNKNGSKDVPQENVQSNAMFGCANEIKVGIEGFVAGKFNVNYEGDRFDISGSENENYTNNVRMSGWKNKSLKEIKTPITSGGGGGGSTNPDTNPTEPTQPYDYTNNTGYADISGTENKVFAMGGRTRGVAGICYSPFGSTEGFWTKAGYLVEDTTKSTETEKYYKPQGLGAKAFGRATHAKEDFTVAGGEHSVALKKGANAIGYYTTANTEWGTVIGKYNVGKTDALFEVGNGYAVFDAGRKNAFEVLKDGRAKVQSAPIESNDVLRLNEFSVLTQKQVDLLF